MKNYYNSFCYYISSIQRLHGSTTLTKCIKSGLRLDAISYKLARILFDYSDVDVNNFQEVYNKMTKYQSTIDSLIDVNMKGGGDPQKVMTYLFLPIIHHYYNQSFKNIIEELNFNPNHFCNLKYIYENCFAITVDAEYNKELMKWYEEMLKDINGYVFQGTRQFCVGTLAIYLQNEYKEKSPKSGHAVTMILSNKDELFIIDDDHGIVKMDNYVDNARESIFQIELKDVPNNILVKLHKYNVEIDKRIYRAVLKFKQASIMIGGDVEKPKLNFMKKEVIIPATIMLLVMLYLIFVTIRIIVWKNQIKGNVEAIAKIKTKILKLEPVDKALINIQENYSTSVLPSIDGIKVNRFVQGSSVKILDNYTI